MQFRKSTLNTANTPCFLLALDEPARNHTKKWKQLRENLFISFEIQVKLLQVLGTKRVYWGTSHVRGGTWGGMHALVMSLLICLPCSSGQVSAFLHGSPFHLFCSLTCASPTPEITSKRVKTLVDQGGCWFLHDKSFHLGSGRFQLLLLSLLLRWPCRWTVSCINQLCSYIHPNRWMLNQAGGFPLNWEPCNHFYTCCPWHFEGYLE